ncbi:MAG: RNA polymerase sigma factor [Deltaproteobacteria bacterium]|nr:RNA polymerase sigma factor [Deltaproteobacteria bacterium]
MSGEVHVLHVVPGGTAAPSPPPVAVDELFAAHAPFLVRTLERLTGNRAQAEDLAQEAFLVAHRRRADLRADGNPRAWLYRVAMNLLHKSRRSFARELLFLGRVVGERATQARAGEPEQATLERERARRVRAAVAKLPLVHREVFVLFELEGLSGADIALMLDVPVATVWTRLHRAREAFRATWDKTEAAT